MADTPVSDSYITTIEDFESRLAGDLRAAAIALAGADSDTQTWCLQRATKNIDALPFVGYKYLDTQGLEHPRKFLIDPEQDSPWGATLSIDAYGYHYDEDVPEVVKAATVEEAIGLYNLYTSASPISEDALKQKGIQSFSLGKLSMTFAPGAASQSGQMKSKEAYDMLAQSGYVEMAPLIV